MYMEDMLEKLLKIEEDRNTYKRKIYKVEQKVLNYYIDYWCRNILDDNRKLLYGYDEESGLYIGIDNSTGECWTEEFDSEDACINWLNYIDK